MGVGLPPLEFTECMNDSPYFRENLHKHEKELENTSQQIKRLIKEVKDLILAAKQLSHAQRTFSKSLQSFSFECIGNSQTDDEVVISTSLREFGRLIAAIEEERDRMLRTAYDQVVVPLEAFRKKHIGGVKEGKKKFDKQTAKFCQSQERYLNLSTKKQDNVLQEADASLDMAERHFYQASMEYVFLLQEVQERKKFEFVETLLCFMSGWLTFYHQGHEVAEDYKKYMIDLQHKIQKTRENFDETRNQTESLKKKMLEVRQQALEEPGRSAKGNTKEGYLFLQEKKAFSYQWVKHYCTYDKNKREFTMLPYNQLTTKGVSPPDKMMLSICVRRMSESIEKRFCFDIQVEDRPGIVYTFQALNEDDRKSWMDIMDGKEPMYVNSGKATNPEERVLDEVGIGFVERCILVLETRGLEEQGLYRTGGVTSKVSKLLSMGLDRRKAEKLGNLEDPLEWENKTVTSALKNYLRTLPEPLMTYRYHSGFIAAAKQETRQLRINDVHTLIHRLPKQNFEILDILIKHLKKVADKSDKNLMTVGNLGVCFGPTLLRPEEETVASIMDLKFYNVVVEILIENYDTIFKTSPTPDPMDLSNSELSASLGNSGSGSNNHTRVPLDSSMGNHRPMDTSIGGSNHVRGAMDSSMMNSAGNHVRSSMESSNHVRGAMENMNHVRSPMDLMDRDIGSQMGNSVIVNHVRSSTPPSGVRHIGITHPQPRYTSYHGNQPGYAVIKTTYCDAPSPVNMSSSLHNVAGMHERDANGGSSYSVMTRSDHATPVGQQGALLTSPHGSSHQQLTSGRGGGAQLLHRIGTSGIGTHSEGNLHSMHGYGAHKYKPSMLTERIYGVRKDMSNSTSSSNESVSSVPEGMIGHSSPHYPFSPEKTKRANPLNYSSGYRTQQGNIRVRTLYACVGEHDGELSFEPNQIITNVRKSQEPGWLEGTLNGKTGLVPENYVEQLP